LSTDSIILLFGTEGIADQKIYSNIIK